MRSHFFEMHARKSCRRPGPARPACNPDIAHLAALLDMLASVMDLEHVEPEPEPPYQAPDWSIAKALPIDLLPDFQALPFAEQVRLRCRLWHMEAGATPRRVAHFLLSTIEANPDIDKATLRQYYREWAHPGVNGSHPYPFDTPRQDADAHRAFWFAIGEGKRPHRRRTLKPDDEQRCIAAMQEALSA